MRALEGAAIATGIALAFLAPRPARACTLPAYPSVHVRNLLIADGATGVPTNAEVRIAYLGGVAPADEGGLTDIQIRPAGGAPIALLARLLKNAGFIDTSSQNRYVVAARPAAPLEPATRYEILDRIPRMPCFWTDGPCLSAPHAVVGSFTTGNGPDLSPPSFAGLGRADVEPIKCANDACCGPFSGRRLTLAWESALDDGPASSISYNVHFESLASPPVAHLEGGTTLAGYLSCLGMKMAAFPAFPGTYFVRAVDLAGNSDENTAGVTVAPSCLPLGDAGPPSGEGDRTSGCTVPPEPSASRSAPILAVLLLLARRRGARAGRTPT